MANNYFGEDEEREYYVDGYGPAEDEYYSPGWDVKRRADTPLAERRALMESASERGYAQMSNYPELSCPEARFSVATKIVFGISSPKGGTGKTTTAKELAYAFADPSVYSINGQPYKVLLVDQNYNNPDISTHFGTSSDRNLAKLFRAMERDLRATGSIPTYSLAVLEKCITKSALRDNLDLMFLSPETRDSEMITADMVEALIRSIKQNTDYDIVLIDTQDTKQEERFLKIIEGSTQFLLITTCETTCVTNVSQQLVELEELGYDLSKIYLVVNGVQVVDSITSADVRNYFADYNILDTVIAHGSEVADTNNRARAVVYDNKKGAYAVSIRNLAEELVPVPWQKEKKGFFARLFGR